MCCNLGCWHCPHVDREAAVVFHWLRRERVFERDIFRFGTGTVRTSSYLFLKAAVAARGKYPPKRLILEIGPLTLDLEPSSPPNGHQLPHERDLQAARPTCHHIQGTALSNHHYRVD